MSDPPPVGAFRDLVYADQGMPRVSSMAMGSGPEARQAPWPLFGKAAEHVRAHDRTLAVEELKHLLDKAKLDTRGRLIAWNCLRALGQQPDPASKDQVQGIVIEVPDPDGPDVLAAYADGSVRYLSPDNKVTTWDGQPGPVTDRVAQMIGDAQKVVATVPLTETRPALKTKVRLTLLTFNGMRSTEEDATALRSGGRPLSPVFTTAASTIVALARVSSPSGAGGE